LHFSCLIGFDLQYGRVSNPQFVAFTWNFVVSCSNIRTLRSRSKFPIQILLPTIFQMWISHSQRFFLPLIFTLPVKKTVQVNFKRHVCSSVWMHTFKLMVRLYEQSEWMWPFLHFASQKEIILFPCFLNAKNIFSVNSKKSLLFFLTSSRIEERFTRHELCSNFHEFWHFDDQMSICLCFKFDNKYVEPVLL